MLYHELRPSQPLAKLVKCVWFMESGAKNPPSEERILPDGCTEIVFNLADPFEQHGSGGSRERQPLTLLVGQMQRPLLIAPTGGVRLLGIRFWPGGAYPFLKVPQCEIASRVMNLDEIWGAFAREIHSRIAEAPDRAAAARLIERILLERLNQFGGDDQCVVAATSLILQAHGRLSIRSLADHLGANPRTLDRRFDKWVGLSPKALSRVVRFQQVFGIIRPGVRLGADRPPNWARVAASCGYYDQPHFIREFKTLAGKEPTAYFAETNLMSDHFTANA